MWLNEIHASDPIQLYLRDPHIMKNILFPRTNAETSTA